MKVVFACRDGCGGRYIANVLHERGKLSGLVVELGASIRRRKLKRTFERAAWWAKPLVPLDLATLAVYSRLDRRHLKRNLLLPTDKAHYPTGIPSKRADNVNDGSCREFIQGLAPDVLVVLGTAILKAETIAIPTQCVLNIHGGIVPAYRNVHSTFWAFRNRDYDAIGTSIIYLDEGIDTGDVALQRTIDLALGESLFDARRKNVKLAGDLVVEAIEALGARAQTRMAQIDQDAGVYKTPRLRDFLGMRWRR